MARRNDGVVAFDVDGKTWRLVCDMNALADFEVMFGVNALEVLDGDPKKLSATYMRGLFWAMLQEHHPDVSVREAGKLLAVAQDKMGEALLAAFPAPEPPASDDDTGKPPASQTPAH